MVAQRTVEFELEGEFNFTTRVDRQVEVEVEVVKLGLKKEEVEGQNGCGGDPLRLFCLRRDNQQGRAKHEHQHYIPTGATCRAFLGFLMLI